ncbi:uncharacterized protein L201_007972 [Kwoniella dendrophila CBS 6074]|uniref:Uncharacterized protein n=1 Tax=Kwoniella dendrophila CBS 6074 TaxID=1295534 RepID=A0AAX4K783_9TREE
MISIVTTKYNLDIDGNTLHLDTPKDLVEWLSYSSSQLSIETINRIKHLHIKFDLSYFRNNSKLYEIMWGDNNYHDDKSKTKSYSNYQLSNLESVNLITKGFNFYIDYQNQDQNQDDMFNRQSKYKYKDSSSSDESKHSYKIKKIITLDENINKLLFLLVNPKKSPEKFIWKSDNKFLQDKYNKLRCNQKNYNSYPKMPSILKKWNQTSHWEFPFLMRPTWNHHYNTQSQYEIRYPSSKDRLITKLKNEKYQSKSHSQLSNTDSRSSSLDSSWLSLYSYYDDEEKLKSKPLEHICIPASGFHKWLKSDAMENLLKDIVDRNHNRHDDKMIIEIKGKLSNKRDVYYHKFHKLIYEKHATHLVQVVCSK